MLHLKPQPGFGNEHTPRVCWERDQPESQNQAAVEILSTYARLERFARDIDGLVVGEGSEAVLEVETFT